MKVPINNIGGEVVKDNETYLLRDNKLLKNLVLSSTLLLPEKETRGHSHQGQEEVYFFQYGYGEMTLGDERLKPREKRKWERSSLFRKIYMRP